MKTRTLNTLILFVFITGQTFAIRTANDILAQKEIIAPIYTLNANTLGSITLPMSYGHSVVLSEIERDIIKNSAVVQIHLDHVKLVQLLSMFEVSFTARQRKNYLFYCLLYLFRSNEKDLAAYRNYVQQLADKYLKDVYLKQENLNEINTPRPGSFDSEILLKNSSQEWAFDVALRNKIVDFNGIFGDGTKISKGIPQFVFNYLDFKLWEYYADQLRGNRIKEDSTERKAFFDALGCADFGLKIFEQFYFSRTRRSLEHYFPQAQVKGQNGMPNQEQINCFGNYAMIGSEVNSSGSDWTPLVKRNHYLDISGKIKLISVASIKFIIMMQNCKDNEHQRDPGKEWVFEDIKEHQERMVELLLD